MAEIRDNKLYIAGYRYLHSRRAKGRRYWDCDRVRTKQCSARAVTNDPADGAPVVVFKGPSESSHLHAPNHEEVQADILTQTLKRKAAENPGQPPAQILRNELAGVSQGVRSEMPQREALTKAMRRQRQKDMPANPGSLEEMGAVPQRYQKTLLGEKFLLHDSRTNHDDDDSEDDDVDTEAGYDEETRVLVFGTVRNIELLCRSDTWFLDGTFKTAPTIFTQLFTVMGLRPRAGHPTNESVALPFVYALLSHKTEIQYTAVLNAVKNAVDEFSVPNQCVPQQIMTDFEKGIHNACATVYPGAQLRCCFFHLCQSVYRRIQDAGLQCAYNDPDDRRVKDHTHTLLALAFVPTADIKRTFRKLMQEWRSETDFKPILSYFDKTYVNGTPRTGTRAAVAPRYKPEIWNQYDAALNRLHRTNNVSEAWHNRLQVMVGKHHPDLFSALEELKKEQADTESMIAELSLGRRVKAAPRKKWMDYQQRIENVAQDYEEYKANDEVLEYLRLMALNIHIG